MLGHRGVQECLGHDSFNDNTNIALWETLAGHGNMSPIYQDLHISWGHIQSNLAGIFEGIREDVKGVIYLAINPVNKADFDTTCRLHGWSVTRILTIEIESMILHALKKINKQRSYI